MAGADDDWTIRYKIDTKAIDAALKKVKTLRKAMEGLHGVGGSTTGRRGGGGRRSINQEHDAHINAMRRDEIRQRREALRQARRSEQARQQRARISEQARQQRTRISEQARQQRT